MDLKVELNNASLIDLEMQVIREAWWTDRSLSYICRAFDQLNKGSSYSEAKPVRQIAFCDFTLFEEHPEFYATYKLINEKNIDWIYTNKFIISNMDLTRPDLATEEDRAYKLDDWCKFFKAETWEEMKMLAVKNETIGKAISGVWQLTEEERIREQCQAREEWIINDRWKTEKIAELTQANEELLENAKIQKNTIADQESTIANQEVELAKYRAQFGPLEEE